LAAAEVGTAAAAAAVAAAEVVAARMTASGAGQGAEPEAGPWERRTAAERWSPSEAGHTRDTWVLGTTRNSAEVEQTRGSPTPGSSRWWWPGPASVSRTTCTRTSGP
jgi:hypothetical protein